MKLKVCCCIFEYPNENFLSNMNIAFYELSNSVRAEYFPLSRKTYRTIISLECLPIFSVEAIYAPDTDTCGARVRISGTMYL